MMKNGILERALSANSVRQSLIMVVLCLAFFYLPFLNKAVHIDDGNFLAFAKAAPLFPGDQPDIRYHFMGRDVGRPSTFDASHPPFIPYLLKILTLIFGGEREYLLHAGFLIFPAVMIIATALLAHELGIYPMPAVLMICANLCLLPVSHNLMADGPMISLWMLAAYLLLSGVRSNSSASIIAASATIIAASLVSYQSLFMIPSFVLYLFMTGRLTPARFLVLMLPVFVITGLLISLSGADGLPVQGVLSEIMRGLDHDRLFNKGLSIPLLLGASLLFIIPFCYRGIVRFREGIIAGILGLALLVPPVLSLSYSFPESAALVVFGSAGILSLVLAARLRETWSDEKPLYLFLLSWVIAVVLYNFFIMPFGALRYIMPAVPPLVFLLMKSVRQVKTALAAGVLTAMVGLAVAAGDYLYASSYRTFASEAAATVGMARERVWYIGEWGMHYYMDQQGFRYLAADSIEPTQGDLIVLADVPRLWMPSQELLSRMELIDVREIRTWFPVRVMGLDIRTGYYATLWGYLPFTLSSHPLERFGIFRVKE